MATEIGRRGGELHVLGLGVDPEEPALAAALAAQREKRRERIETTLDVLASLDLDVRASPAERPEGGIDSLGRPHAARALVNAGHATSVQDAFTRYLDRGQPAYVPRLGIGPREAIEAIAASGRRRRCSPIRSARKGSRPSSGRSSTGGSAASRCTTPRSTMPRPGGIVALAEGSDSL